MALEALGMVETRGLVADRNREDRIRTGIRDGQR